NTEEELTRLENDERVDLAGPYGLLHGAGHGCRESHGRHGVSAQAEEDLRSLHVRGPAQASGSVTGTRLDMPTTSRQTPSSTLTR
ncbi:hypothetical protein, partial [Vibrio alginolyticus]|uniref:hypothetical protein n=1 Tax=Vibrio alginolyticus TaxID=663 RepID=UPI000AC83B1A